MWPFLVVVRDILAQQRGQVLLVGDGDVVEPLAAEVSIISVYPAIFVDSPRVTLRSAGTTS